MPQPRSSSSGATPRLTPRLPHRRGFRTSRMAPPSTFSGISKTTVHPAVSCRHVQTASDQSLRKERGVVHPFAPPDRPAGPVGNSRYSGESLVGEFLYTGTQSGSNASGSSLPSCSVCRSSCWSAPPRLRELQHFPAPPRDRRSRGRKPSQRVGRLPHYREPWRGVVDTPNFVPAAGHPECPQHGSRIGRVYPHTHAGFMMECPHGRG